LQFPRFQKDVFDQNLWLVDEVERIAAKKGTTPANIALAWVRALSNTELCGDIIAIPGATSAERVSQNLASSQVELSPEEMAEINAVLKKAEIKGGRYADYMPINT
jgi:pyridoxine 4-dehydrogenase